MQIRQSGGLGSAAAVSIRGSSSKQVQVFLDGMLLNDPLNGGVDLSFYTLHDIARIQVFPSSPPARFTSAGVGGVVAMESLGADTPPSTQVYLGAGSFDTFKSGLLTSGGKDRFHYWLSLNRQTSDNDYPYENRAEWFNPNDGAESRRRNADVTQNDVSAKLGYTFNDQRRLDTLLQWSDRDRGIPSIQNWANNRANLHTKSQRVQVHYQDSGWLNGRLHSSHRLLFARSDESYQDLRGRVGTGRYDVRTDTDQVALNNSVSWLTGGHTLSASLDLSLIHI